MKLYTRVLLVSILITHFFAFPLCARQNDGDKIIISDSRNYKIAELIDLIDDFYPLSYNDDVISFQNKVFLQSGSYSISGLLVKICKNNGLKFEVSNNQIFLSERKVKLAQSVKPSLFTINGNITSSINGEAIIGCSIALSNNSGVISNGYGFYSITLKPGEYTFTVSHTGFKTEITNFNLTEDLTLDIALEEKIDKLPEVVVQGRQPKENITGIIPGVNNINFRNKGDIPYFLGEVDVLQTSLLLPGINNLGEDANGINIRGGSTSQNLILLDESVIFNSSHLYGLISVFNPESVNDVEIFKGSIPSRYGGRSTSVINIRQREGNDKKFSLAGGIGLVAGRLTLEGPIIKEKASFLFSARRSLINLANITTFDPGKANFVDLNFKVNIKTNEKNKFYLSGYYGDDKNENNLDLFRKWGNRTLTLRWNHLFSDKLFSNASINLSEYTYKVTNSREAGSFQGTSKIINYDSKLDFSYYINQNQLINFGGGMNAIKSNPGDRLPLPQSGATNPLELDTEVAVLPYLYAEQEGKINKLSYNIGIRLTSFFAVGSEKVLEYGSPVRSVQQITDTVFFQSGEIYQSYFGIEPRGSLNYKITDQSAIKLSYSKNQQYLHLISNTLTPAPTDIWKISDTYIKPTISNQVSLGYYKNFTSNIIEASAEVYYRGSKNVIEYKDNADLVLNENIETEVLFGEGRAYGLELFLKKNSGYLTGWISYTLSKSETKVSNEIQELSINSGEYFPNNFDQTHQFSTTGILNISKRVSLSTNFIFSTGKPTTLPAAKYELGGIIIPHFTQRNKDRLPTYHRLDVSLKLTGKLNKIKKNGKVRKKENYWTFSIYNLYSRRNVFSYVFRQSVFSPDITEVVPVSILGSAIPSVTYNFKF